MLTSHIWFHCLASGAARVRPRGESHCQYPATLARRLRLRLLASRPLTAAERRGGMTPLHGPGSAECAQRESAGVSELHCGLAGLASWTLCQVCGPQRRKAHLWSKMEE